MITQDTALDALVNSTDLTDMKKESLSKIMDSLRDNLEQRKQLLQKKRQKLSDTSYGFENFK